MLLKLKQAILNWLGVTSLTLPVKLSAGSIVLKDTDILVVYSEQTLSENHKAKMEEQLGAVLKKYNYSNKVMVCTGGLTLGSISKEVE